MRFATVATAATLVALSTIPAQAQAPPLVVNVPAQQPTIQAGIDTVAVNGTVIVAAGLYRENINYRGKAVEVRSANGPGVTVIDGGGAGPVVSFASREGRGSVLKGFTVTKGRELGGVWVAESGPTITGNIISGNNGPGVDMYLNGVDPPGPLLQGNVITGNTQLGISDGGYAPAAELLDNVVERNGGGIRLNNAGNTLVRNNVVRYNTGMGLLMINSGDQLVVGNVIAWNDGEVDYTVPYGSRGPYLINNTIVAPSGVAVSSTQNYGAPALYNNVIVSGGTEALTCTGAPSPAMTNNLLFRAAGGPVTTCAGVLGANGNFSADPRLVNPGGGDFRLAGISPGVDVGTNGAPSLPPLDADGGARIVDGDGNGSATIDVGAYEAVIGPGVSPSPSPLSFGSLPAGQGASRGLTLTGVGRLPAHVRSVSVTGSGFRLSSNGCMAAFATLPANATCPVTVTFTPIGPGTYTGTLTFTHDGRAGRTDVALTAVSLAPQPSKYVRAVYLATLGREPTVDEFTFWDARLAAGLVREAFVYELIKTPDFRRIRIAEYYNSYLLRPPNPLVDPFEVLVAVTAPGLYPLELVGALIQSSDEYYTLQAANNLRHGDPITPNVRFVKGLFYDVLGRIAVNGDPALAFLVAQVNAGQSRLNVAGAFQFSREFHERLVRGYCDQLLGRPADPVGLQVWVDQLQRGMRTDVVLAYFLASAEYLNRVNAQP